MDIRNAIFICTIFAITAGTLSHPRLTTAHFAVAPKIHVSPRNTDTPNTLLLDIGSARLSQGEFLEYLQTLTAFDTKYDRLQPKLAAHLELMRGIALYHPMNVHDYVDKLNRLEIATDHYRRATGLWAARQLEVAAGMLWLNQEAQESKLHLAVNSRAILAFNSASAKTALLESIVVYGDMPATLEGLRSYFSKLSHVDRRNLTPAIDDRDGAALTPPDEQRRLRDRWRKVRKALLAQPTVREPCRDLPSMNIASNTVLVEVGSRVLTLADYFAIYGKPVDDRRWQGLKKLNCRRAAVNFAAAALLDEFSINERQMALKIKWTKWLYLASSRLLQIFKRSPTLGEGPDQQQNAASLDSLRRYPNILGARDRFLELAASLSRRQQFSADQAFLMHAPWRLERKLTPMHVTHM